MSFQSKDELIEALRRSKANPVVEPYGHIETWDVSKLTNFIMLMVLAECHTWFNYDISRWKFGHHETIHFSSMFENCYVYNQPFHFHPLKTQRVYGERMFQNCLKFNSSVSFRHIITSDINSMFADCRVLNAPISFEFDYHSLMHTEHMFSNCTAMESPIYFRGIQEIYFLDGMFEQCHQFNQPLDEIFGTAIRFHSLAHFMEGCGAYTHPIYINGRYIDTIDHAFDDCIALPDITITDCRDNFLVPTFKNCPATVHIDTFAGYSLPASGYRLPASTTPPILYKSKSPKDGETHQKLPITDYHPLLQDIFLEHRSVPLRKKPRKIKFINLHAACVNPYLYPILHTEEGLAFQIPTNDHINISYISTGSHASLLIGKLDDQNCWHGMMLDLVSFTTQPIHVYGIEPTAKKFSVPSKLPKQTRVFNTKKYGTHICINLEKNSIRDALTELRDIRPFLEDDLILLNAIISDGTYSENDNWISLSNKYFFQAGECIHPGQLSCANFVGLFFRYIRSTKSYIEDGFHNDLFPPTRKRPRSQTSRSNRPQTRSQTARSNGPQSR